MNTQKTKYKIVFLTGAGISKESGIPTYTDSVDNYYHNVNPEILSWGSAFDAQPVLVLDFYNERRLQLFNARPNHAHKVIAELEKDYDVVVITQNVDDLHERAGSTNVIHTHGELTKVTSSQYRTCLDFIQDYPLDKPIHVGDKALDGSQLRPYVVFMDEYVSSMRIPEKHIKEADIFVIVGTSLRIGAGTVLYSKAHPYVPKFIIDPCDYTDRLPDGFTWIPLPATEGMNVLLEKLKEL